jgi:hypothetical protein
MKQPSKSAPIFRPLRAGGATAHQLPAGVLLLVVGKEGMPPDLPGSKEQASDATRSSRALRGLGRSSTGKNRRVYFDKQLQTLLLGAIIEGRPSIVGSFFPKVKTSSHPAFTSERDMS